MRTFGRYAVPILTCLWGQTAHAQSMAPAEINPPLATVDENNVDMTSGQTRISIELLPYSLSPNGSPVSVAVATPLFMGGPSAQFSALAGQAIYRGLSVNYESHPALPTMGGRVTMPGSNGTLSSYPASPQSDGSRYWGPQFIERGEDGPAIFTPAGSTALQVFASNGTRGAFSSSGTATQIVFPDGETWDFIYNSVTYVAGPATPGAFSLPSRPANRIKFILSSRGYGIQFSYLRDGLSGTSSYNQTEWQAPTKVTYFNRASVFCDTSALVDCGSLASLKSYATISYDNFAGSFTIKTPRNRTGTRFMFNGSPATLQVEDMAVPGSTRTYTVGSTPTGLVTSVYNGPNGSFQYSFSTTLQEGDNCPCGGTTSAGRSDPLGGGIGTLSDINQSFPMQTTDSAGLVSDLQWRRGKVVALNKYSGVPPYQSYSNLAFQQDGRGNITKQELHPSNNGSPISLYSATFPIECLNPKTCNKPATVTDGNGNTTSYTYNTYNGAVAAVTYPAVGGVSPVQRYEYGQRYAWIRNGAGGFVHAGDPIWVLIGEKTCRTTATNVAGDSCAGGAADEVVTSYDYGPDTGLIGNILLLRGKSIAADGTTLRTCYGYDESGNKIWERSPRAGLAACY